MSGADWGPLLTGVGLIVGAVFTGLIGLRNVPRGTSHERKLLDQYDIWRPRVRRVVTNLRDLLAEHRIPEPDGIDEEMRFPPRDEVTSDE